MTDTKAMEAAAREVAKVEDADRCKEFSICFGDGRCGCRKVAQAAVTAYLAAIAAVEEFAATSDKMTETG